MLKPALDPTNQGDQVCSEMGTNCLLENKPPRNIPALARLWILARKKPETPPDQN